MGFEPAISVDKAPFPSRARARGLARDVSTA
jgi:hypothetical protein